MEPQLVVSIISAVVVGASFSWGVVTFLLGRIAEAKAEATKASAELHARVNNVRDEYLRRDDYNRDRDKLDRDLAALKAEVKDGFFQLNKRLDLLLARKHEAG